VCLASSEHDLTCSPKLLAQCVPLSSQPSCFALQPSIKLCLLFILLLLNLYAVFAKGIFE
ncbi:hypothetical protein C8J23_15910, partial [Shewanella chilikensis]